MLPGAIPPTSAWWARVTAYAAGASPSRSAIGLIIVRSGRWVPPR